jgi:hypothetical protein
MKWDFKLTCSKCKKSLSTSPWKSLDVVADPHLRDVIVTKDFNICRCSACGFSERVQLPIILWEHYFNAVVLGKRLKVEEAIGIIKGRVVDTKPSRADVSELVIVFGVFEQLMKALTNTDLTRVRIPIWDLLRRDWSGVTHPLEDAAEALIQRDKPERAFQLYAEVIRHIPELYADPDVNEKFLMSAHLAGSRILPEQLDGRTALEQVKEYEEKLGAMANLPQFLSPYQVDYCPVDESLDVRAARLEGDQHASVFRFKHIELPQTGDYEKARGCLLVHFLLSASENWLGALGPDLQRWWTLNQMAFDVCWPNLHSGTKDELREWFRSFTGADIRG